MLRCIRLYWFTKEILSNIVYKFVYSIQFLTICGGGAVALHVGGV